MSEPDELYTLRNLFWLGNFQVLLIVIYYGYCVISGDLI